MDGRVDLIPDDLAMVHQARLVESAPIGPAALSEVRRLVFETAAPFPAQAGQAIAVLAPGPERWAGKPHCRLYTIAEQPSARGESTTFVLWVRRRTFQHPASGEQQEGFASSYLCRLEPGASIRFGGPLDPPIPLPEPTDRRLILVSAGLGIAPFRAYLRRLAATDWRGRVVLFHGPRTGLERLYRNESWRDVGEYLDAKTFDAIESFTVRPTWMDRVAWDEAVGVRAAEVEDWLAAPTTRLILVGIREIADDLERVFEAVIGREAWPRLRAELVAAGRWTEVVY